MTISSIWTMPNSYDVIFMFPLPSNSFLIASIVSSASEGDLSCGTYTRMGRRYSSSVANEEIREGEMNVPRLAARPTHRTHARYTVPAGASPGAQLLLSMLLRVPDLVTSDEPTRPDPTIVQREDQAAAYHEHTTLRPRSDE